MGLSSDARPETMVEFARRRIKTAISDGTIAPGSRLSPGQLASDLGLSHIPVREALTSLSASGFVRHDRGRGFFSRELSADDLADVYRWRAVLEREAYKIAVPILTDGDIAQLDSLLDEMSGLTSSESRLQYLELNRAWHFVPFRRAGSRRLLRFLNDLWDSAEPYTALSLTPSELSHEHHVTMMKDFRARDAEAVMAAMEWHRNVRTEHFHEWSVGQREG